MCGGSIRREAFEVPVTYHNGDQYMAASRHCIATTARLQFRNPPVERSINVWVNTFVASFVQIVLPARCCIV